MIRRIFDSMGNSKIFEGFFGFKSFLRGIQCSHMHKGEVKELIDKNGGDALMLPCQVAFDLSNKTSSWRFQLVHMDALSRMSSNLRQS